jgi:hypothetical protein
LMSGRPGYSWFVGLLAIWRTLDDIGARCPLKPPFLHRPDDGLDGEYWRFNGLAARVCKICTRPFAFSFAFVPVREPHSHPTRHDQTRSDAPSLPFDVLRS